MLSCSTAQHIILRALPPAKSSLGSRRNIGRIVSLAHARSLTATVPSRPCAIQDVTARPASAAGAAFAASSAGAAFAASSAGAAFAASCAASCAAAGAASCAACPCKVSSSTAYEVGSSPRPIGLVRARLLLLLLLLDAVLGHNRHASETRFFNHKDITSALPVCFLFLMLSWGTTGTAPLTRICIAPDRLSRCSTCRVARSLKLAGCNT